MGKNINAAIAVVGIHAKGWTYPLQVSMRYIKRMKVFQALRDAE